MRKWLQSDNVPGPRPLVLIEDNAQDAYQFCKAISAKEEHSGDLLSLCTVLLLDRPGPDTKHAAIRMLIEFPENQVIAGPFPEPLVPDLRSRITTMRSTTRRLVGDDIDDLLHKSSQDAVGSILQRFGDLPQEALRDEATLVRILDEILRPGGMIVCDIELETLKFPGGSDDAKLFEGVRAASTACRRQGEVEIGQIAQQQDAQLIIVSGREKFSARLDKKLGELGVRSNGIYRKREDLAEVAVLIRTTMRQRFPWSLQTRGLTNGQIIVHRIGREDQVVLDQNLDVVIWPETNGVINISGSAVAGSRSAPASSSRAEALRILVRKHLAPGTSDVPFGDIARAIEEKGENMTPSQLIGGINRMFRLEQQRRVIPRGANSAYRIGDDVNVGIIED